MTDLFKIHWRRASMRRVINHRFGCKTICGVAAAWLAGFLWCGQAARATALPINNPGFDAQSNSTFDYEGITYHSGDPIPDHTYTTEDISGNGDNISAIGDSASGALIPSSDPRFPATITIFGYTGSPGSGLVRDSRDYLPGQGPTGPGALISSGAGDNQLRGIFQTLTGTEFQPNTTYTFTAQVSDRRFGTGDNVTLHSNIQLSLAGNIEPAGSFVFVPPPAGGTSLATFMLTTGAAGDPGTPTGDITLVIRAGGYAGGDASQSIFDNLTLDASPVPEPATTVLSFAGVLLAAGRRRRQV
jgi:hypothetical protein